MALSAEGIQRARKNMRKEKKAVSAGADTAQREIIVQLA
jgi:hypothetical protein